MLVDGINQGVFPLPHFAHAADHRLIRSRQSPDLVLPAAGLFQIAPEGLRDQGKPVAQIADLANAPQIARAEPRTCLKQIICDLVIDILIRILAGASVADIGLLRDQHLIFLFEPLPAGGIPGADAKLCAIAVRVIDPAGNHNIGNRTEFRQDTYRAPIAGRLQGALEMVRHVAGFGAANLRKYKPIIEFLVTRALGQTGIKYQNAYVQQSLRRDFHFGPLKPDLGVLNLARRGAGPQQDNAGRQAKYCQHPVHFFFNPMCLRYSSHSASRMRSSSSCSAASRICRAT